MGNSGSALFAEKTSEDRVLGKQGDAMFLAGAVCRGLAHILCVVILVGCAKGGARNETSRCFPYYISVGIEVLDMNLESTASKVVVDAILSMGGHMVRNARYAMPLQECFVTIERPGGSYASYIEINLYLSDQHGGDPREWITRYPDKLNSKPGAGR